MSDNEFELDGIFDDLAPEDFLRETSAYLTRNFDTPVRGQVAFEAFITEQLDATAMAYVSAEGLMNPIAVLHRPDARRFFTPEDDETLGHYLHRIQREAEQFGASWCFIALVTQGGVYESTDDDERAVDDPSVLADAKEQDALHESICWYAEMREQVKPPDELQYIQTGIISLKDGHPGEVYYADPDRASDLFRSILSTDISTA